MCQEKQNIPRKQKEKLVSQIASRLLLTVTTVAKKVVTDRVTTNVKSAISVQLSVMRFFGLKDYILLKIMPTRVYEKWVIQNRSTTSDMSPTTLNVSHISKLVAMLEKETLRETIAWRSGRICVPSLTESAPIATKERSSQKTISSLFQWVAQITLITFNLFAVLVIVVSGRSLTSTKIQSY